MGIYKQGRRITDLQLNNRIVEKIVEHETGRVVYDRNLGNIILKYFPLEESGDGTLKAGSGTLASNPTTFIIPKGDSNYVKNGELRITVDNLTTKCPICQPYDKILKTKEQLIEVIDNTTEVSDHVLFIDRNAMAYLPNLSSVILPFCTKMGTSTPFYESKNLQNVNISSVQSMPTKIFSDLNVDQCPFYVNNKTYISLPLCSENQLIVNRSDYESGVINIKTISYNKNILEFNSNEITAINGWIFDNCKMLSSVSLPNLKRVVDGSFRSDTNGYALVRIETNNNVLSSIYDGVDNKYHNMLISKHIWTSNDLAMLEKAKKNESKLPSETEEEYQIRINEKYESIKENAIDLVQGLTSIKHFNNNLVYGYGNVSQYGSRNPFYNSLLLNTVSIDNFKYKTYNNHIVTEFGVDGKESIAFGTNINQEDCETIRDNTNITAILSYAFSRKPGSSYGLQLSSSTITKIYDNAFWASSLKTIDLDGIYGTAPVMDALYEIKSCKLNNVSSLPASYLYRSATDTTLTCVEFKNVENIGDSAFNYRAGLKTLDFPKLKKLGNKVFNGCEGLEYLNISSVESIGLNNFKYCNALLSIYIPETNTCLSSQFNHQLITNKSGDLIYFCGRGFSGKLDYTHISEPVTIDNAAFMNCSNISALEFNELKSINGDTVFNYCSNLRELKFNNTTTVPTLQSSSIFNYQSGTITIKLRSSLSSTFILANNWCNVINYSYISVEYF